MRRKHGVAEDEEHEFDAINRVFVGRGQTCEMCLWAWDILTSRSPAGLVWLLIDHWVSQFDVLVRWYCNF